MTQAADTAAAMIADSAWSFATDPQPAIARASVAAATAYDRSTVHWGTPDDRLASARHWVRVGLILCREAGVEAGDTLVGLAKTLHVTKPW